MVQLKVLSSAQERRLVDYFDQSFLEFSRIYNKRTTSSATQSLNALVQLSQTIFSLIINIPPFSPSAASLRVSSLLRLTGEVGSSIVAYDSISASLETDLAFWDLLDNLDIGWHVILSSQIWDATRKIGMNVQEAEQIIGQSIPKIFAGVSQTDRIRILNLLLGFKKDLGTFFDVRVDVNPRNVEEEDDVDFQDMEEVTDVVSTSADETASIEKLDSESESEIESFKPMGRKKGSDMQVFRTLTEEQEIQDRQDAMKVEPDESEIQDEIETQELKLKIDHCFHRSINFLTS